MALLSIPHEHPLFDPPGLPKHPAYLNKTETRWVDCPQEELDKLSLPVIKSYLADGKIPLKYAERSTFLDSGRKLALGSAALGLCVAAGVMYNFGTPESNLTEAAVSLGIGAVASGIHVNIVMASNMLADELEIYGPLSRWHAHRQTKHVKQLIGDRHQAATATTYELRSLIAEHNQKLDPLYHLEDNMMTGCPSRLATHFATILHELLSLYWLAFMPKIPTLSMQHNVTRTMQLPKLSLKQQPALS